MRNKEEIIEKAIELKDRHLKDMISDFTARIPINCSYNCRMRVKEYGKVGFCICREEIDRIGENVPFPCDTEVPERCKSYKCKNTLDSIKNRFNDIIKNPALCGSKFPKLAILIWCIQDSDKKSSKNLYYLFRTIASSLYDIVSFKWLGRNTGE